MKSFLTAEWRNLFNITYAVKPEKLISFLPKGLELDIIDGNAFISLVPFMFFNTRLNGFKVPFHTTFPEMNLRFYVKYGNTRGIVFIKELVPKFWVAFMANNFYHEKFGVSPIKYTEDINTNKELEVSYSSGKNCIKAIADVNTVFPDEESNDAYFKNLEFAFTSNKKNETLFFRVNHPEWSIYPIKEFQMKMDIGELYGKEWHFLNEQKPYNICLVKGSEVEMLNHQSLEKCPR